MKTLELWAAEQIGVSVEDVVSVETQTDPGSCGHCVSPDHDDREKWPIDNVTYAVKVTTKDQTRYVEVTDLASLIAWFAK